MIPGEWAVQVRLFRGEQDGMQFDLPEDWDASEPPLHTWVLTAQGERQLATHVIEPDGLRDQLTTCAYRYIDTVSDPDTDEIVELHYARDQSADIVPDLHSD